jgi:acetyl esterase/lipase
VRAVAAAAAVLCLVVAGCARSDGASATRTIPTSTTLPQPRGALPVGSGAAEDLPDLEIAPGACQVVSYTPLQAPSAQKGQICVPAESRHDVGIILVHGGGGISGDYRGMASWSQPYLDAGYTTFAIDYTLFDPGQRDIVFPQPEQDVKAAVQFLRGSARSVGVDPERIVIQGLSAGARLGAVAYTTGNDTWFGSPTAWPGIADHVNGFVGLYGTYDGFLQHASTYYGGDEHDKDRDVQERWDKANAIANAENARGPAIFFSGDEDWDELIDQMDEFADLLTENGLDAQTTVVAGGDHGYDQGSTGLSKLGKQSQAQILFWLADQFPVD